MIRLLLGALLLLSAPFSRADGMPEFSWMTLNGISHYAPLIEGVTPDLEGYGVEAAKFEALINERLAAAEMKIISQEAALTERDAAQLLVKLSANHDPHGFYYYGLRLMVRRKLPLGNPAGGFVSEVVWSAGENGVIRFGEGDRLTPVLEKLLAALIAEHRQQNTRS